MTDDDALDTIKDVAALRGTDAGMETLTLNYGIERLRGAHALMSELLPVVGKVLRNADEKELAEARERVEEIEARLKNAPASADAHRTVQSPILPASVSDYAQTDAGMGIGGGREPEMSAQDLRDELHELRERTAEKRRKRGL